MLPAGSASPGSGRCRSVPRVNDKRVDEEGERQRFSSKILRVGRRTRP
jgi:hypothetical protein